MPKRPVTLSFEPLCLSQFSNPELGNWKVDVWVELLYGVKLEAVLLSVICPFITPAAISSRTIKNVTFLFIYTLIFIITLTTRYS